MVPSCSLTKAGLEGQRRRQARLAPHIRRRALTGNTLLVVFDEGLDRATLEEMVAIERECCPFFELSFDEGSHALTIAVGEADHLPALAALARALGN
jgi:hypothetical protein